MNWKNIFGVICLFTFVLQTHGQSIVFIRTDLKEAYNTKSGKAKEIKYSNKFYTSKKKEKKTVLLSEAMDTIREQKLSGSKVSEETIYILGTDGKVAQKIYNKRNGDNWAKETTSYKYNKTGLVQIKTQNDQGKRIGQTMVVNDHKKNPIKLTHYDKEGVLSSFETAVYNYNFGTWVNDSYGKDGKLLSQKKFRFEPKPHKQTKTNDKGDVILEPINIEEDTYYITTYKYDYLGNWVKKKVYKAQKVGEKFKKKKHEYYKRKIKYHSAK